MSQKAVVALKRTYDVSAGVVSSGFDYSFFAISGTSERASIGVDNQVGTMSMRCWKVMGSFDSWTGLLMTSFSKSEIVFRSRVAEAITYSPYYV
jgi:hypothetical protein